MKQHAILFATGVRSSTARTSRTLTATMFLVGAALAGAQGTAPPERMQSPDKSSASMSMKQSMSGMMKSMQGMPMSGDTDRDFASMMKMHHQGAIDMAQAELANGKDPQLRKMAQDIIAAQRKEIKEFEDWLKAHPMHTSKEMHK
ncbi:MAG: DUF305 domain-containing protein [Betaproteobacteria bacterium]